ncbi:acetamidase/formamidase family protein [Arthrobacter zhaoxinii]|uniref:Acetamidase/formamidase family protein n=1 Tax=Arthrobacter zhaoxinii TaxID=2964616 RepID=A0ABY5YQN4_9MICC|nr:acetamidase/formamidase family protein [Arthrobacter zhaoxinii]UWX97392.1 acetamidase/formamidase family protein [Arthrobacter zhaoxinii]
MNKMMMGRDAAEVLTKGLGRRGFLGAAAGIGALAVTTGCTTKPVQASSATSAAAGGTGSAGTHQGEILQPHSGNISGDHYLVSTPEDVLWGYVPTVHATPVARMKSGQTITIDALSHEGIMEDQGRDPLSFFGGHGVEENAVLQDAVDIAAGYNRTARNFDTDGPHVVTGPVMVEGAEPGDVLKIETLDAVPRVPYGVVSSRHGKGALALQQGPAAPEGITLEEVMPPAGTDNRASGIPTDYHNVSVFTAVEDGKGVMTSGDMKVRFPLRPFMGMMGVAFAETSGLTDPEANSVPPTLGGGNIDIRHLGPGSTFYLPVKADGALFYVGDPHMGMGDGEVALTAMEGSLRGTFRLTVCKPGSGDAPALAHRYPFGETADAWIPIGLSDPDGLGGGVNSDLNIAMRRAVVNALDFLEQEKGMDRAVAYAYLSAAADFALSQVVDRTVGVHGLIRKADFS